MHSRLSLSLGLADAFPTVGLGLWAFGGRPRGKMPFSPHHSKATCCLSAVALLTLTLVPWLRLCLSDVCTVKSLSPFSMLCSLEVTLHSPRPRGGGYTAPRPREKGLVFLFFIHVLAFFCMALGCQFASFKPCPSL